MPYDLTATIGFGHHQLDVSAGSDENANSAQFLISKALTKQTNVYGTIARKVDAPTIRQLYEVDSGNPDLGFQRATHYEVGLKTQWDKANLHIAFWQSDVDDFIERDEITDIYENRDELRFKGVDISAGYQVSSKLKLNAAMGYLDSEDRSDDAVTDRLQYRPSHKATLQAIYQFLPNWQWSGDVTRIGTQYYFSRVDSSISQKLDSYELVNTRLKYTLPNGQADVYAGVENLFDTDYETSYGFPQPGRFIYTGLNLRWN